MKDKDVATREKILAATVALLKEEQDPGRITVRQIADRAGAAIGALNYHFQSKENLVNLAVDEIIGEAAAPWSLPAPEGDPDPVARLRRLFKDRVTAAFRYRKLSMHALSHWVLNGEFEVETQILPLLREIFGRRKSETELRLLAFQLVITIQVATLRRESFHRFVGFNLNSETDRVAMIDMLIDHLIQTPEVK